MNWRILAALAVSTAFVQACNRTEGGDTAQVTAPSNAAADEQAINRANQRWLELIRNRDAAAIAQLYTEDGAVMPPNMPIARGRQAVQHFWQSIMQMPGFSLNFETEELILSSSRDMALDRGTYRFAGNPPEGEYTETGKYVVVWRKVGDEWKVAADIFNSDSPAGG